jgi:hypothetical protein
MRGRVMTATKIIKGRPTDQQLETARDLVIEAARDFSDTIDENLERQGLESFHARKRLFLALSRLDHIERLREERPAVIQEYPAEGWDFNAIVEGFGDGNLGTCDPRDAEITRIHPCPKCNEYQVRCECFRYTEGLGNHRHRNLAVCGECGYVHEW